MQLGGIQQGAAETIATMPEIARFADYEDILARLETCRKSGANSCALQMA